MKEISSEKNPRIQRLIKLREKSAFRRSENVFLIEGVREINLALKNEYEIREIFFSPDVLQEDVFQKLKVQNPDADWISVHENVFQKIAVRESTEGMIAVAQMKKLLLTDLKIPENPLLLIVEAVEKPGNLGALLRTTDASATNAVIICDPTVDIFNPNVIRSSLGCVFSQQIAVTSSEEAIGWLKSKGIKMFAATPGGAQSFLKIDFTGPSAIAVGSEASGLSEIWLKNSEANVAIPMHGEADSLNVSVSAAIILFEAVRQRML